MGGRRFSQRIVLTLVVANLVVLFDVHPASAWPTWPFRRNKKCGKVMMGKREARIVGGVTAAKGEFPFVISFKGKHGHFCGGSMISNTFLLTAAHCLSRNEYLDYHKDGSVNLKSLNVTLGEYSLKNKSESTEVTVAVKKIHIHPSYDYISKENDIAVVEIAKSVSSIAPHVGTVCLPSSSDESLWKKDTTATVVGWGKLSHSQDYYDWVDSVDMLRKVEVRIWDTQTCINKYKSFPKFPSKSFICAGQQGKESCTGDSGSPLLNFVDDRWVAVGIVANGNKCGANGRPGIYTLVADFGDWISKFTK